MDSLNLKQRIRALQMVNIQNAIQVLDFLFKSLSQKPLGFEAKYLAVPVARFDFHRHGPFYLPKVAGYGQAALRIIGHEPKGTVSPGCDIQGEGESNDYKGGIGSDGAKLPAGPADIQTICERGGADKGLVHRNRGRPSNRRKPCDLEEIVLALYREQYWDLGPTLAAEKLRKRMGRKYIPPSDHPWRRYSLRPQPISQALP